MAAITVNTLTKSPFNPIDSTESFTSIGPAIEALNTLSKRESTPPLLAMRCIEALSSETTFSSCFSKHELTRSIPIEHQIQLTKKISSLTEIPKNIERITTLLKEGSYSDIEPNDFYYALAAMFEGLCDESVVVRISDILSLKMNGIDFETVNLKAMNKDERIRILNTIVKGYIESDDIVLFSDEIDEMDQIDCILIRSTVALGDPDQKKSILARFSEIGFTCFHESPDTIMIPNLNFFDKFVKISCKENAINSVPRFGKTTIETIRHDFRKDQHVVGCSYIIPNESDLPPKDTLIESLEADSFYTPHIQFNLHDRYHVLVASNIPKEIRELSLDIADAIRAHAKSPTSSSDRSDRRAMYHIAWELEDLEISEFIRSLKYNRISVGYKAEIFSPLKTFFRRIIPILEKSIASGYAYAVYKELESDEGFKKEAEDLSKIPGKKFFIPNFSNPDIKSYISTKQLAALIEVIFQTIHKKPEFKESTAKGFSEIQMIIDELEAKYDKYLRLGKYYSSPLPEHEKKFATEALESTRELKDLLSSLDFES